MGYLGTITKNRLGIAALLLSLLLFVNGCGTDTYEETYIGDKNIGQGLFMRYCSHCHGTDAKGGLPINAPDIRGRSFEGIVYAVKSVSFMEGLKDMLERTQLQDISAYLRVLGEEADNSNQESE